MTALPSLSELRHELLTPVNHIIGYAEMLLEDVEDQVEPRGALEATLDAARNVLASINDTLLPTRESITAEELDDLLQSLGAPQQQIIALTTGLLESETAKADEVFAGDVTKVLEAAKRLTQLPEPAEPGQRPSAQLPKLGERQIEGPSMAGRVLVVDDIEENRDVLRRRLEREGCTVETANGGRDALNLLGSEPFDLVLLDVLMPEMNGYDVLDRLKDDDRLRDIPVIMISALDDLAWIVRCIQRGAADYLPKPFDPVLLRARVGACLEQKRLRDAEKDYLKEVNRVVAAAAAVEASAYTPGALTGVAGRDDELGRLARVFDNMATQIQAREERLRHQVRDLQDEIAAAREAEPIEDEGKYSTLITGQRFAERYEVLATIGEGGMGMVYRAHDEELGEDVAIKTLRPELVIDPVSVERFKRETLLARKITHRNVVRTHDFGQWQNVYFLTMEYVEGITVRTLIDQRGHLNSSATLAIARQLVDSIAAAHDVGVIHRDIKPQNLLLDEEGVLKVMDFGVARLAERTSDLTEAGITLGTPSYMPPEQLLGDEVDGRCDLYAVGVVLYECLTGHLPFEAQSVVSLIAKVLNEEPAAPNTIRDDIPAAFSALIMKLLSKEADERIQTAPKLAERLAGLG